MRPLRRTAIALAACAAALSGGVAAAAAAAWTPPQELPNTAGRFPLFAAFGPGGDASVGMYGPLTLFPGSPQAPVAISGLLSTTPTPAPAPLPDGLGAPIALSPGGTLLAAGGPRSPLDYFSLEGRRARLRVGIGPVDGVLKRIPTHAIVATKTLASAVNDAGDAAVVFSRCRDKRCAQRSVLMTYRRRGRGFADPIVLAGRTGYPVASVALNPRGDAIVAWIQHRAKGRGNDIRVRTRLSDGKLTKLRLAGPTAPVPEIAVTLTNGRHGTVAWFSEAVGEGSLGGPLTVYQTDMDSHGALTAMNILDRGTPTGHGEADAVRGARLRSILGADGVTTYVWTGFANGHYVVRAIRLHRDTGLTETLSPPNADAQLADLAVDRAGDALVVWTTLPSAGVTSVAAVGAVRRLGGATTFGGADIVLAGAGAEAVGTAAGAIAPGGRALVAGGAAEAINGATGPGVRVTQLPG
jgi:hypothetical protein